MSSPSYAAKPYDPGLIIRLISSYPDDQPRLMFRTENRYTIFALAWQVHSPEQSRQLMAGIAVSPSSQSSDQSPNQNPDQTMAPPWGLGWFGLIDYDSYAAPATTTGHLQSQNQSSDNAGPVLARIYRCLVIDSEGGTCTLASEEDIPSAALSVETEWHWQQVIASAGSASAQPASCPGITLTGGPEAEYLVAARSVIADIRQGRFYQLNLLRFFTASLQNASNMSSLTARFLRFYEPYSLWFRWQQGESHEAGFEVLSFSPERFVAIEPGPKGARLIAEPIKGTAGRSDDPATDDQQKAVLLASTKDQAELHMIVDLLRHDMWPLCEPQSIAVRHAHQLRTFQRVHHLVATIEGGLKPGLSLEDCWQALLPAGSITGTPKREVMTAIRQLEGRPRGYFMGIAFHLNPHSGRLDSSVLIRTLVRKGQHISYGAGSGLVIRSDPDAELAEIKQKCRVVTDALA